MRALSLLASPRAAHDNTPLSRSLTLVLSRALSLSLSLAPSHARVPSLSLARALSLAVRALRMFSTFFLYSSDVSAMAVGAGAARKRRPGSAPAALTTKAQHGLASNARRRKHCPPNQLIDGGRDQFGHSRTYQSYLITKPALEFVTLCVLSGALLTRSTLPFRLPLSLLPFLASRGVAVSSRAFSSFDSCPLLS